MSILFAAVTILLAILIGWRPDLTRAADGKILAFIALFILPCVSMWSGGNYQLERATSTQFCVSCHVMEDYGRSLYIDDRSYVPAAHFQNNRIPRDQACYTCHTDYTMFGGVKSKWRGLHHVYVQYIGKIPKPEDIKLYEPFNNRECLHCHAGARSFEDAASHHKKLELLETVKANKVSCMSSGCHDIIHEVGDLKDAKFWKGR